MKLFVVGLVFSLAVVSPQRLGVRLNPTGGGGGGSIITQSDITLLGYSTIPGWEGSHPGNPGAVPVVGSAANPTTCDVVSGVVHCFTVQVGDGTYAGPYSVYEYIDPGTYGATLGAATAWTYYRNWGFSTDAVYDMYHNKYGKTFNGSGTLVDLGGLQYSNSPSGVSYHEIAGDRYIYISYGLPYGAPPTPSPWNLVACRLDNPGTADAHQTGLATTCTGPYRVCAGVGTPGGSDFDLACGQYRGSLLESLPDNTMGASVAQGFIHSQSAPNAGPSLWGGTPWITLSTPDGFGSTRSGNANLRTTDIQMVTDYLSHYLLTEANLNADGTLAGGAQNWTGHRPSYPTASLPPNPPGFKNYQYNGGTASSYGNTLNATSPVVNPDSYGGIGSWVNGDTATQAMWVQGTKSGVLFAGHFAVGPFWYKTRTAQQFTPLGTGSPVLMARDASEAWSATANSPANSSVEFNVVSGHFTSTPSLVTTVVYTKDGANTTLSCSASSRAMTVHLGTDGSNVITSTANNVVSIVNGTPACAALASAQLCVGDCNIANTGAGVVTLITTDYAGQTVPSGILILAYGPQLSPIGGIDLGINVTGPNAVYEAAIMVYDPSKFQQTPDYNVTPDSFIWLNLIDSNFPCATQGSFNYPNCSNGGSFFDPTTRRYYVIINQADVTTVPGTPKPVIAVFQIAGSALPEPTFLDWLVSLAPNFRKSVAHALTFFEMPR